MLTLERTSVIHSQRRSSWRSGIVDPSVVDEDGVLRAKAQ
jgi:hypothetical protein